jgi:hypothetical protein
MIDVTTNEWIPDFAADETDITIPLASLGISQADANGDVRVFVQKLMDTLLNAWFALTPAERPQFMRLTRSPNINSSDLKVNMSYGVRFEDVEIDGFTLPAEPSEE